jgi:hypothetical protein
MGFADVHAPGAAWHGRNSARRRRSAWCRMATGPPGRYNRAPAGADAGDRRVVVDEFDAANPLVNPGIGFLPKLSYNRMAICRRGFFLPDAAAGAPQDLPHCAC